MANSIWTGIISGVIVLIFMPLLNPAFNYILTGLNIIQEPKLSIEVTELKEPSNEEDIPISDSYLLNVISIINEDKSKEVHNLILAISLQGVVFKVDYNVFLEDRCIVYRPKKVEISNKEFSPIYFKMEKIPNEIKGSNTVIIGCENLIPGEMASFRIYTDKNGICDYRCSSKGYVGEYRWDSYYKINKKSISGNIKSTITTTLP